MGRFLSRFTGRAGLRLLGVLSLLALSLPLAGLTHTANADNQIIIQISDPKPGAKVSGVVDLKGTATPLFAAIPTTYAEDPWQNQHFWYDVGQGPVQWGWLNAGLDVNDQRTIIEPQPDVILGGGYNFYSSSRYTRSTYWVGANMASFDTTLLPNGPATFGVTVISTNNQTNTGSVNVVIDNTGVPPTPWVAFLSPKEKDTVSGIDVAFNANGDVKRTAMPAHFDEFDYANYEYAWAPGWDPTSDQFTAFYWDNFGSGKDTRNSPLTGTPSVEILPCDENLFNARGISMGPWRCTETINPVLGGNGAGVIMDSLQLSDGPCTVRLRVIHRSGQIDEAFRHITVDNSQLKSAPKYFELVSPKEGEIVGGFVPIRGRAGFPGQMAIPPTRSDIQLKYWKTEWAFGSNPTDYDWHLIHMHYNSAHFGSIINTAPNVPKGTVNAADLGFATAGTRAQGLITAPTGTSGQSLYHHINVGTRGWFQSYAVPNGPYTLRLSLIDTHGGVQEARVHVLVKN